MFINNPVSYLLIILMSQRRKRMPKELAPDDRVIEKSSTPDRTVPSLFFQFSLLRASAVQGLE